MVVDRKVSKPNLKAQERQELNPSRMGSHSRGVCVCVCGKVSLLDQAKSEGKAGKENQSIIARKTGEMGGDPRGFPFKGLNMGPALEVLLHMKLVPVSWTAGSFPHHTEMVDFIFPWYLNRCKQDLGEGLGGSKKGRGIPLSTCNYHNLPHYLSYMVKWRTQMEA